MSVLTELKEIKRRFLNEEEDDDKENVGKDGNREDPKPSLKKDKDDEEDQGDKKKEKQKKVSQEEANYIDMSSDPDKRCSSCIQFVTPGSCHKVEDDIDPDGLCRFFERKESKEEK